MKNKRLSMLQLTLTVLFVSSLLISNIVTSKQVALPFDIVMTGGVFIFPVTYVLSDLFSEVYGYKWSRYTCYLAFVMNILMVAVIELIINAPAPDFWNNQEAFQTTLGNTPRVLTASMLAFLVGDLVNDKIFKKLKEKHPNDHKGFGFRAILSSLCGEIVDSAIFMPIVFFGQMPLAALVVMGITEIAVKTIYETLTLPLTRFIVRKVSAYETKN